MAKLKGTTFSGKQAFEHLEHLAVTIGPRLTGSAGEHKAARYIAKTFRALGLRTRLQRFPVTTYQSRKCVFEVRDRGKWRRIKCEPVMQTPSTPPRGLTGELHVLESGSAECFSPEMRGKIVLLCGRIDPEDRPKFLSFKPKALVTVEPAIGENPIRVNLRTGKDYGELPMARILHLDGLDIVKRGLGRARLTMINAQRKSHSFNVIGEKPGTDLPEEIVVVCGHYDTSMGISGASDNAGGTALVMELARIFAKEPTKRTLRFIAFAAEETGLNGSCFYANDLAKKDERDKKKKTFKEKTDKTELGRHRLTFNIDVHGYVLGSNTAMFSGTEDVGASVRLLAKEAGRPCNVTKGPMSSDGTSLAAVGVPAVQFARGGGPSAYLHSPLDEIKHLSPGGLAAAGEFAELYLRRYVTAGGAFPFPREIPEDQMKDVKEYFKRLKRPVPGEKGKKKRRAGK